LSINELIKQIDAQLKRQWGRPLCSSGVKFLNEHADNLESLNIDILQLGKKPSEELLNEWRKRNEMARQCGYDVYIKLPETREKLEEVWRERRRLAQEIRDR